MKKHIGLAIARVGARLWIKGGFWNESARFEDLTKLGQLGYNLFIKGFQIAGITEEDIAYIIDKNDGEKGL